LTLNMLTLLASGLISSFPLQGHQLRTSGKRDENSLDPVNGIHVVRRRNLESRADVGEVDFTLSVGVGLGSGSGFGGGSSSGGLGGGRVGSLAPALFSGCTDIGGGVLLERLTLERDGGNTSTGRGQRNIGAKKQGTYSGMNPNSIRPSASFVP
jgi:hypothetical protein